MININRKKITKTIDERFAYLYTKLLGKNVLILDLETTGLICNKKEFANYTNNDIYDQCRIIEIGYSFINNFKSDNHINIYDYFRKPHNNENISVSIEAQNLHNISNDIINNQGHTLIDILQYNLYLYIMNADYIICHNINFDMYVLLNELHRINQSELINKILNMHQYKRMFCTCIMTGYKKLTDLYSKKFNCIPNNAHRAYGDVKLLIELIFGNQLQDNNYKLITNILPVNNNIL